MAIELNSISNSLTAKVRSESSASRAVGGKTEATSGSSPSSASVQLSERAQELVRSQDESIDQGRVESIRQQLAEGSYSVDYQKLAGRILDIESRL